MAVVGRLISLKKKQKQKLTPFPLWQNNNTPFLKFKSHCRVAPFGEPKKKSKTNPVVGRPAVN